MPRRLAFASLTSLTLFSSPVWAQNAEKITYEDHVRPLLENKCFSCHNPDKKKGDLDLTSMGAVLTGGGGGAVVDAGNAEASRLWTTCAKKEEPFMPPEGAPLNAKELEILSAWITGGLLETKSSIAKKSTKPKVDMSVAVTSGKPEGPIAKPEHVLLEPVIVTPRTTAVVAMAASPWTSLAAVAGTKQILLYDTDTKQLAGVFPYTEGYARSLRFSRNGSLLVMGGGRGGKLGHAIVWEVKTGKRIIEVGKEFDQVMSADISPDHKMVVLGSPSKKVKVFDTATGEELYVISKHTEWVMGTAFSPDGVLLATSDRNGNVMVWEAANGGEFYILGQHKASCTDLAWRGDSNLLASCSMDGTISLWEMNEGKQVKSWSAHGGGVQSVAFTPDGQLVSSGNDGLVRTWDINGNKKAEAPSQGDIVTKVVALHDSKACISANWRGEVKVLSLGDKMPEIGQLSSNPPLIAQRIVESEKKASEVVAQLPSLEAAWKKAQEGAAAAEAKLAEAKKKAAEAQTAKAKLEAELNGIPAQVAAFDKQTKELQGKRQAALTAAQKFEQAQAEAKKLEGELAALSSEKAKLTTPEQATKLAEVTSAISAKETKLAELRKTSAPQPSGAELDPQLKALADQVTALHASKAPKTKELESLKKGLEAWPKTLTEAEQQLAAAKTAVAAAQGALENQKAQLALFQKLPMLLKAAQFNVGVLTEKENLAKLEGSFNDYTAAKKENEDAKQANLAKIESSKKIIAESTNAIPQHEATLNKLKAELNGIEQAVAPTKAADVAAAGKLEAQKKTLSGREAEVAALAKTRDEGIASAKKSAEDIAKAVEGLKKKLGEVAAKLKGPAEQVTSKQADVLKLEQSLGSAQKSAADLTASLAAKEKAAQEVEAALGAQKQAVQAAEKALNDAQGIKDQPAEVIAKARAELDSKRAAKAQADKALQEAKQAFAKIKAELGNATSAVAKAEKKRAEAKASLAAAEKAAAPLRGQHDSISKEIAAQEKAGAEKLAQPAALEADFAAKAKPAMEAIAQIKSTLPELEKAFAEARSKLEAEIKVVDAKKQEVTQATEALDTAKKRKAQAEATLAAAEKDIPVRDKNLAEIQAELGKLQPQLDPLRAKVKQLETQYFTLLPQ